MTEIYIVKQIDNSRLTKEVDYEHTKECLLLMILGFFCLLIFLILAWQHFKIVRYGYESEALKREWNQLADANHQLKLERAYLRSPQRIDLIAKTKLGLRAPSYDQVIVLSRLFPSGPSETLVAKSEKVSLDLTTAKEDLLH
jgi:cell division protein FtsL